VHAAGDHRLRRIPTAPPVPYEATFAQFVEEWLDALLPCRRVILAFHRELMGYVGGADPLFIVRYVKGQERGEVVRTRDGTRLLPSDNAPAWWWHMKMFHGATVSTEHFAEFMRTTPTHLFQVSGYYTVNTAGWHAAHILDAKDGDVDWRSWTRADATWRFVRNMHPLNLFYVPKVDWPRVGRDPELIGYVAWVYATRWPEVWEEFTSMAGTPALRPDAGGRILQVDRDTVPRSGEPAEPRVRRSSGRGDDSYSTGRLRGRKPWDFVLGARRSKAIAKVLAQHPDADAYRRSLVHGLTVERFVALGNALYNYTRIRELEKRAPGDPVGQAEIAFHRLEEWMTKRSAAWIAKQYRRPSGWTGAIAVLREGSDEGLRMVRRLDLPSLVTAALRVVDGPYYEALRTARHRPHIFEMHRGSEGRDRWPVVDGVVATAAGQSDREPTSEPRHPPAASGVVMARNGLPNDTGIRGGCGCLTIAILILLAGIALLC